MKWINDVVFAILAAHVWGSLMLFVWLRAVKRLENKGYTRLLFYLLRAVIVAYLLPLGLGAVLIINEILVLDGRFMQTTPVITMICLLLFVIWILGFFANFESLQEKWDMTRHCFQHQESGSCAFRKSADRQKCVLDALCYVRRQGFAAAESPLALSIQRLCCQKAKRMNSWSVLQ
mgnify:CR=1 FL=1